MHRRNSIFLSASWEKVHCHLSYPLHFWGHFFYSFLLKGILRSRSVDNYVMAVPLEKCHNSFMLPFLSFSMFLSRFTSFIFILVFLFHFSIDALYVSVIFLGKQH